MDGTLIKIKSSISRFLDQTMRAFKDALQTGKLLCFRVIRHFSEMLLLISSHLSNASVIKEPSIFSSADSSE